MLAISATKDRIYFGNHFAISFKRTLRIPNDGKEYPLPAGLGSFPIYKVADHIDNVPFQWIEQGGGVFIPMYQSEALWIKFHFPKWHPHALKIGAGRINVINGLPYSENLVKDEKDYLVCPDQPWLDGFNMGDGTVRQFVATPFGSGLSVETQITGEDKHGGIQIVVYAPKPGLFPDKEPQQYQPRNVLYQDQGGDDSEGFEMGFAAGGKITQKIYSDRYGFDTWDLNNYGKLEIHILNSRIFQRITGLQPPPTPVTMQLYKDAGFPWFKIYDDEQTSLSATRNIKNIKST